MEITDFIVLFHLVEYLKGFDDETSIEEVMTYLESDLEHYMSKENKTLRDHFEIIQTKFFIDAIKRACNVFNFKTSSELVKTFTRHLELNYIHLELNKRI